ncbi:MAG: isoprenylcysteine carboxylmethyltransferase family protein [Planctomycetes bacterium]|nr:isoprenylcysteine carboxylmethyltransferase family protein [Planctomycetota bacterium]
MKRILPPAWLLLCLAAMTCLHCWWPVARFVTPPFSLAGLTLVAAGIAAAVAAIGMLKRAGTNIRPEDEPLKLVNQGVYSASRNPVYLGLVLVAAGTWVCLGSASPGLAVVLLAALLQVVFIAHEERAMAAAFGEEYRAYQRRVRRWL